MKDTNKGSRLEPGLTCFNNLITSRSNMTSPIKERFHVLEFFFIFKVVEVAKGFRRHAQAKIQANCSNFLTLKSKAEDITHAAFMSRKVTILCHKVRDAIWRQRRKRPAGQ